MKPRPTHARPEAVCVRFAALLLLFFTALFCLTPPARATQSGTITGVVTDGEGNPIANVNVIVVDTRRGAASDLDGYYVIKNIAPGSYDVMFSALGYNSRTVENVHVVTGRRTSLDMQLYTRHLEMAPLTIEYPRPPVKLRETGQQVSVLGDEMREMPVSQADEVIKFQAGVVMDAAGMPHVRGGRSDEIGYVIDGMRVGSVQQRETSFQVSREALNEIQLLSGTFSAEYGEAMSGVLNISTQEGRLDRYHVTVQYETPPLNPSPFREKDWWGRGSDALRSGGQSLYENEDDLAKIDPSFPVPGRTSVSLSGPLALIPKTSFFLSAGNLAEQSHLPYGAEWMRDVSGKFTHYTDGGKVSVSFGSIYRNGQEYDHVWKYDPERHTRYNTYNNRLSFTWHTEVADRTFLEMLAGWVNRREEFKAVDDWQRYRQFEAVLNDTTLSGYFSDPAVPGLWTPTWSDTDWSTSVISAKISWMPNPRWEALFGWESYYHRIAMNDLRAIWSVERNDVGQIVAEGAEYYKDYSQGSPEEMAFFMQTQYNRKPLTANLGLRWDVINTGAQGWIYPDKQDGSKGQPQIVEAEHDMYFSPRLGIAYSLFDHTAVHGSIGLFHQMPDYRSVIMHSEDIADTTKEDVMYSAALGNPVADPQRTWMYEAGVKHQISTDWGVTVTGYVKDVNNLLSTKYVRIGDSNFSSLVYGSEQSARMQGLEVLVKKAFRDNWSFQATYTWSFTEGAEHSATEVLHEKIEDLVLRPGEVNELNINTDHVLDFDRRHVLNAVLVWQGGREHYPRPFGSRALKGVSMGLLFNAASGLPYTETAAASGGTSAITNSGRMAPDMRLDMRLAKTWFMDPWRFTLFARVDNVFDRRNPRVVNPNTGEPWSADTEGMTLTERVEYLDWVRDPSRVDPPRQIRLGATVEF